MKGTVDLLAAITQATVYGASTYMGAAYWIRVFWVPASLVTHYITFLVPWKYWPGVARRSREAIHYAKQVSDLRKLPNYSDVGGNRNREKAISEVRQV